MVAISNLSKTYKGGVRALRDVPESPAELHEQRLAPLGLGARLVEGDALQHLSIERADEEMSLPLRDSLTGVESHGRRTDRGRPVHRRHLHAGPVPTLT